MRPDPESQTDPATEIVLSQTDPRPMYRQIEERIKQLVGAGEWESGREIPSIRQLAVALRVSVITVKRAYLELEREGVIVTRHGKGSVVAPRPALRGRLQRDQLASQLEQVSRLASEIGLSPKELAEVLVKVHKEMERDKP
jgi:GntR family transcriptional regulator